MMGLGPSDLSYGTGLLHLPVEPILYSHAYRTSVRDPEIELLFTDVNVVFAPAGFGIIWLNYFKPVGNGGPFKGRAIRGTICRVREFDHFLRRPPGKHGLVDGLPTPAGKRVRSLKEYWK